MVLDFKQEKDRQEERKAEHRMRLIGLLNDRAFISSIPSTPLCVSVGSVVIKIRSYIL